MPHKRTTGKANKNVTAARTRTGMPNTIPNKTVMTPSTVSGLLVGGALAGTPGGGITADRDIMIVLVLADRLGLKCRKHTVTT